MCVEVLLKDYDESVEMLIRQFQYKQFFEKEECITYYAREFDGWVGDIIGGIALFEDLTIDFADIVYDLRTNQPKGNIIEWIDYCCDLERPINYHSYCKGLRI